MINNKFLLVALAGIAGFAHAGDLYRWTDAQGVQHFSDTPPPQNTNPAQVTVERNKMTDADSTLYAPPKTEGGENGSKAETARPSAPAKGPSVCDQARTNVQVLQSKYQVADASGKALDDKARAEMLAQAKSIVDTCH